MRLPRNHAAAVPALLALGVLAVRPAHATAALFNFSADTLYTTTTSFTDTSNGIGATFGAPLFPPGGFLVTPAPAGTVLLAGSKTLSDGFYNLGGSNIPLTINFSQTLRFLSLDFVTGSAMLPDPQTFTLDAFVTGSAIPVASVTVTGARPAGSANAEGVIGLSGLAFNQVQLSTTTAANFAVGNIGVNTDPAVPEASCWALAGLGLLPLGLLARRRCGRGLLTHGHAPDWV